MFTPREASSYEKVVTLCNVCTACVNTPGQQVVSLEKGVRRAHRFPKVGLRELCLLLQRNGGEGGKGKGGAGALCVWLLGVANDAPQQPRTSYGGGGRAT